MVRDGWTSHSSDYCFHDPQLDEWIHAVGAIVRDPAKLDEVQRKYLSTLDQIQMKRYMMEDELEENVVSMVAAI